MAASKGDVLSQNKNFYRLTAEGRLLWSRRGKLPLPLDYRRILGLVDFSGHREVIRSYLARYPEQMVDAWLVEFEEARLIESADAEEPSLPDLARKPAAPPLEPEDIEQSEPEVVFADTSLTRLGVYTSYDRIANRPPSPKSASETVALVVEDDPDQLALAVLRLTMGGYRVKTADSIEALYAKLAEGLPDAIFLDIGLPDGNGFDLLTALRQHPTYTYLPIIMLTAQAEPADVARGLALGCDGYITKPYGRNTLEYVLRYVMKQEISAEQANGPGHSARTPDSRISFSQRS
jgi:CheY-like chemotaxis protein